MNYMGTKLANHINFNPADTTGVRASIPWFLKMISGYWVTECLKLNNYFFDHVRALKGDSLIDPESLNNKDVIVLPILYLIQLVCSLPFFRFTFAVTYFSLGLKEGFTIIQEKSITRIKVTLYTSVQLSQAYLCLGIHFSLLCTSLEWRFNFILVANCLSQLLHLNSIVSWLDASSLFIVPSSIFCIIWLIFGPKFNFNFLYASAKSSTSPLLDSIIFLS